MSFCLEKKAVKTPYWYKLNNLVEQIHNYQQSNNGKKSNFTWVYQRFVLSKILIINDSSFYMLNPYILETTSESFKLTKGIKSYLYLSTLFLSLNPS